MIEYRFLPSQVVAVLSPDETLGGLSFSLEMALEWFLGRGITSLSVERTKGMEGHCFLTINALSEPKPMAFSGCTPLADLVEQNYFPKKIEKEWKIEGQEKIGDGETVFKQGSLLLTRDNTMALLAYSVGDVITGFFSRGCTKIKQQFSVEMTQIWFNYGMSPEQLKQWMSNVIDYDANKKVSDLSLHFDPKNN